MKKYVGTGIILTLLVISAAFVFSENSPNPHRGLRWTGTGTCLACHESEAREVHTSVHNQWMGEALYTVNGPDRQGKMEMAVNSYCVNTLGNWNGCGACHVGLGNKPAPTTAPSLTQLQNLDCLLCHQQEYKRVKSNGVFVPDTAHMKISMDQAVQTVHKPQRVNCLQCHAKGGGGDNYKRGDLALAHTATTDKNFDVHMATTGKNMSCQTCHQTGKHRIAGRGSDLRQTDLDVPVTCSNCHKDKATASGHDNAGIGRHVGRVACQTCHISTYARNAADTAATEATEVHRDWTKPHVTASGAIHPTPTMANNLKPVYRFWSGTSTNYNLKDPAVIDPATGRYPTSRPLGSIADTQTGSKLYPFKYKTAYQPLATRANTLIALDTSVYFKTGDLVSAIKAGLANMKLASTEPYSLVTTDTLQLITHEVRPESQALQCSQCHGSTATQMKLKDLGYVLKGTTGTTCTQCHGLKKSLSFNELHKKHVTDKKYDCSFCHSFARPERGLVTRR